MVVLEGVAQEMAKTAMAEGGCQHPEEGASGRHRQVPVATENQLVHQLLEPGNQQDQRRKQQIETGSGDQAIQTLG
jgi:hypothetical protein